MISKRNNIAPQLLTNLFLSLIFFSTMDNNPTDQRIVSEHCNSTFPRTTRIGEQLYEQRDIDSESDEDSDFSLDSNSDPEMYADFTSDIDAINLYSHQPRELIDVSCRNGSIWKIGSNIQRTKCDSGSRINFHFDDYPKPRFAHRSSPNNMPAEWFPNLTFSQLQIAEGVTLHFTFYLLGCPHVRSCPYFTKLELSVFVSAMNFARNYWFKLSQTKATLGVQTLGYQKYMNQFQRFAGIVQFETGKKRRQNVNEDLPSSFGRIFVASIFEAIKLFAEFPDYANSSKLKILGKPAGINTYRSHLIYGHEPSLELFSYTAAYMTRSGVLSAKSVGLKKSFEGLPKAHINLNNKLEIDVFLKESFTYLTNQIGLYFDPDVVEVVENIDNQHPQGSTDPADTQNPSLDDIQYSNSHAVFDLERSFSSNVMVFWDMGLNITPHDLKSSFIPSGVHSMWMVNNILNGSRIALPGGAVRNNSTLYEKLSRMDNPHLLSKILKIISRRQRGEQLSDDAPPDVLQQSILRVLPIFDFEREVLDLIQDELAFEPDIHESNTHLGADEARTQVFLSKNTAYPILSTNGMFSNIHSGKIRIDVAVKPPVTLEEEAEADLLLGVPYDTQIRLNRHAMLEELELFQSFNVGESMIKGMQVYWPASRNTSRKRVDKGHGNIVRFPLRVAQLLTVDPFLNNQSETEECITDVLEMMDWIEAHLDEFTEQLATLVNAHTRIEFFLQYQPDLDLARENLEDIPNLGFCLEMVKTKDMVNHLTSQSRDCMRSLRRLKHHLMIHRNGGTIADFRSISKGAKAGWMITSELLIALLDFFPYQPWHLKTFMEFAGRKHGAWCIPEHVHISLSPAERELTGLAYGVDPKFMKRQIPFSRGPDNQFYSAVKASSMSISHAYLIRKKVRLSIFYVQALEKLQSVLQYYSAEREGAMLTTVEQATPADGSDNPGSVMAHADLMLLEDIDYSFLANRLTNGRRNEMFGLIGEIASDLYQQNWHDLLSSKKYAPQQADIAIDQIPKSKSRFVDLVMGNIPSQQHLDWGFFESSGERVVINTPRKCKGYDFLEI
jgi:hypothetical protein